jgi:phosphate:Na+ symporter
VLVFAAAVDIHLAVLVAMGLASISFSVVHDFKWRAMSSIALGVALLLYGSYLVTGAAADVGEANWLSAFLNTWYGSALMAFAVGAFASFVTQSTATVAIISVALAGSGLLDLHEAITMIYGANLGSTLMRILLTRRATGTLRQVSRFQDAFKIAGTAIFLLLFVLEERFGVPLVEHFVTRSIGSVPLELATVNLFLNGSMAVAATALAGPIERLMAKRWAPSAVEDLSIPKYATAESLAAPATAIDLLEKEQMRILKSMREYLALVRPHTPNSVRVEPVALHRSFTVLFREIDHFYITLVGKHLDQTTSERLGNVHGRQELLELVEASLFDLAQSSNAAPDTRLATLIENFAEALDFLLMFAGDAARTLDRDRAQFVCDLSSDRGDMMSGIRSAYLAPDQALTADEKALLVRLTNLFERVVWMIQRYSDLLLKNVDSVGQ